MKISKKVLIIGLLILSIVIALIIYFKNVQNENITPPKETNQTEGLNNAQETIIPNDDISSEDKIDKRNDIKEYTLKTIQNTMNQDELPEEVKKDISRNDKYQELYKNLVFNDKALNIEQVYDLEKQFHNGEYNFDLKHPYNLALAIDISAKYKEEHLMKFLFVNEESIQNLSNILLKDGSMIEYTIKVNESNDSLIYLDKDNNEIMTVYFLQKANTYLIDKIELPK